MCDSQRPLNGADSLPFDEPPLAYEDDHPLTGYEDDPDDPELSAAWDRVESAIWERE